MIQENDIRAKLLEIPDLDEFEDWLVQHSWDMQRDSDHASQQLVGKIELALAEYSNGHLSESELRQHLKNLARTYEVSFNPPSESGLVSYSSNSTAQRPLVELPIATVCVT